MSCSRLDRCHDEHLTWMRKRADRNGSHRGSIFFRDIRLDAFDEVVCVHDRIKKDLECFAVSTAAIAFVNTDEGVDEITRVWHDACGMSKADDHFRHSDTHLCVVGVTSWLHFEMSQA